MSEPQSIGNLLDSLGLMITMGESELVSDAIVLVKVVDEEGEVTLREVGTSSLSWIERIGMLRAAENMDLADLKEGDY